MLMLMRAVRMLATVSAAVSAAVLLAGCFASTSGTGHAGTTSTAIAPPAPTGAPATSGPPAISTPASSAPAQSRSVSVVPAPSTPIRVVDVNASERTYVVKVWAERSDTDCVAHAYGAPVISYLQAHPCAGLTRLLATTEVAGRPVAFAQSSIGFAGPAPEVYQTAGNFRTLVGLNGTGSVNDLLREGRRMPSGPTSVPSPDAFNAMSQDAGVTIVDAWYLDGATPENDPALVTMATDIYLQV
jgi:hypothetical protein